jgi:hypothetical protein
MFTNPISARITLAFAFSAALLSPRMAVAAGCSSTIVTGIETPTPANSNLKLNGRLAAQTFKAPGSGCIKLQSVTVSVQKHKPGAGSFGDLEVRLYTTSGGAPNAAVAGALAIADTSSLLTDTAGGHSAGFLGDVTATFATPVSLAGGTTYAIVLTSPGTTGSAHYEIGVLSDSYADGQYWESSDNLTWTGTATDAKMTLCFVPCSTSGCTLSQGFWKNHSDAWPVSSLSLGNTSYTKAQLISILQQPSAGGNGLLVLAHQLIAAKVNIAAGADGSALGTTIADSDFLIGPLVVPPVGAGYLSPASVSTYSTTLDNFNNGIIGPGHCAE